MITRTELAHRSGAGIDVTLEWVRTEGADQTVVRVRDDLDGRSYEIAAEPRLALDVYYHPYAYVDFGLAA